MLWVMGGVCTDGGAIFLELIPQDRVRTMVVFSEILSRNIDNGTTIMTDCHPSYNSKERLGKDWTRKTVNQSYTFISEDGVCTNSMESLWVHLKIKCKHIRGV